MKTSCKICNSDCTGKDKIIFSKKEYIICNRCFIKYEFTPLKEVHKIMLKK